MRVDEFGRTHFTAAVVVACLENLDLHRPLSLGWWRRSCLADPRLFTNPATGKPFNVTRRRNLEAFVNAVADHADWEIGIARPTHKRLAEVVGVDERSIRTYAADLIALGWLAKLEEGRYGGSRPLTAASAWHGSFIPVGALTAWNDPKAAEAVPGVCSCAVDKPSTVVNTAVVYGLSSPVPAAANTASTSKTFRPSLRSSSGCSEQKNIAPLGAGTCEQPAAARPRQRQNETGRCAPRQKKPPTQEQVFAEAVRALLPPLRHVSAGRIAAEVGIFRAQNLPASDVLWCVEHRRDGLAHTYDTAVHSPIGWLRSRLAEHVVDGFILDTPSLRRARSEAAAHVRKREYLAQLAAEKADRERARNAPPIPAREALRAANASGYRPGTVQWRDVFDATLLAFGGNPAEVWDQHDDDLANPPELTARRRRNQAHGDTSAG